MTFHESTSGESLLARKGAAVPASLNGVGFGSAKPEFEETGLAQKPHLQDAPEPASEGADPAPPASLLAFDFLNEHSEDVSLLPSKEMEEPQIEALAPEPVEEEPQITVRAPEPEPAPFTVKPQAPAIQPSWRVGVETLDTSRRKDGWTGRMTALALVLGVVAIGWYAANREPGVMVEKPVTVTTSPSEPAAVEPAPAGPPEPAEAPPEAAPAEAAAPVITPAAPEPAADPQPVEQTKAPEAAEPAEPSVDVVRIDPDGSAVIAGRAAPNAELIILDNGAPIGTATADGFGEWVFIPDTLLPTGGHEFGLVVKSVKGRVSVPPPGEGKAVPTEEPAQEEPAKSDSDANAVPIPLRKPVLASEADFTVQLASVKTKAGAEREWQDLQNKFPVILGGMRASLDEAKVSGNGTVVRVRTGGFATLRDAIDLCARLTAKRQECLVIRGQLAD